MDWSTAEDLQTQVRRLWDRGRLLVPPSEGGAEFPLPLRLRRPDSRAMSDRFGDVRQWIRALDDGSKARRGFGYEIEWTEIDHRQVGRNRVPAAAFVPSREDALRLVGRQKQADRFEQLSAATLAVCPELRAWTVRKPMSLLENGEDWERILAVLVWFRAHPCPAVYLRQLDITGVDTKFIETRKALLTELLDLVLPSEAVDAASTRHFEGRYGLLSKPSLIRFRILDQRLHVSGLSDITAPASQLARLQPVVRRVFITENEVNGLVFPDVPDAMVIFGLGYGLERLAEVRWLRDKAIYYWGDIDTHGFAILDRLRLTFPDASSLLMDRDTLMQHRTLWVQEDAPHAGPLTRLTPAEQSMFDELVANRLGERVRLEQERIGFGWVLRAIGALGRSGP